MTDTFAVFALLIFLFIYLTLVVLAVANYIVHSLALYRISKQRGLTNSWLAWVPIAYDWTIGNIVDSFDGENGIDRNWRKVLITMSLVMLIAGFAIYMIAIVFFFVSVFSNALSGNEVVGSDFIAPFVIFYIVFLILAVVALALQIARWICYYKIFEAIRPEKAIKYLLLSVMVPLALPICLMKCSKIYPLKYHFAPAYYSCEDSQQIPTTSEQEETGEE